MKKETLMLSKLFAGVLSLVEVVCISGAYMLRDKYLDYSLLYTASICILFSILHLLLYFMQKKNMERYYWRNLIAIVLLMLYLSFELVF